MWCPNVSGDITWMSDDIAWVSGDMLHNCNGMCHTSFICQGRVMWCGVGCIIWVSCDVSWCHVMWCRMYHMSVMWCAWCHVMSWCRVMCLDIMWCVTCAVIPSLQWLISTSRGRPSHYQSPREWVRLEEQELSRLPLSLTHAHTHTHSIFSSPRLNPNSSFIAGYSTRTGVTT